MKYAILLAMLMGTGCTKREESPKPVPYPKLEAQCRLNHWEYRIYCRANGNCYGDVWPADESIFEPTAELSVRGTSEQEVADKLSAHIGPLPPDLDHFTSDIRGPQ